MNMKQKLAIIGATCALVAGCGGGSSDDTAQTPSQPSSPSTPSVTRADAGPWQTGIGTYTYSFGVDDTGETWGYKMNQDVSTLILYHGQQSISGSSVSGSYLEYNLTGAGSAPITTSYTGTAQAKNYLNLVFGNSVTLNYNYNSTTPINQTLANFQGTWAGVAGNNLPGGALHADTMTVSGSSVSFPKGANGCQVTGTITPQATITRGTEYIFSGYSSPQCGVIGGVQLGGATMKGVMAVIPQSITGTTIKNGLVLFVVTTDNQVGIMFIGYQ